MSTKEEIIDTLKGLGIEHDPAAKKADLEALIPATPAADSAPDIAEPTADDELGLTVGENPSPLKLELIDTIKKWKVQNPTRFDGRKDDLQRQLDAIK